LKMLQARSFHVLKRVNLRKPCVPKRRLSIFTPENDFDVTIVGAGHNGLVAANYLSKAGFKVGIFESRPMVGGAAVTEEIFPGYKFSRASYVCSLLHNQIIKEMMLVEAGLVLLRRNPSSFTPTSNGSGDYLLLGPDSALNHQQISKFSAKDAEQYGKYSQYLEGVAQLIEPFLMMRPFDPFRAPKGLKEKMRLWFSLLQLYNGAKAGRKELFDLYELMVTPANKILDRWFESDLLKATLATDAVIGSTNGLDEAGSGYVLLHHVMGNLYGRPEDQGVWAYVQGGMGSISECMAKCCVSNGVRIFTSAAVKEIIVEGGRAKGVRLENGDVINSKAVMSNATPAVTFEKLIAKEKLEPNFLARMKRIDYSSGVVKINLAMDSLPNFRALPSDTEREVSPQHRGTIHFVRTMQDIQDALRDSRNGEMSQRPVIELTIPSSLDKTLAPEGHYVASLFCQYAPYKLKGREWDDQAREEFCDRVFNVIEEYAPGFKQSVLHKEVLAPPDLERIFGLTGGNIFHGAMSMDQLYMSRPIHGYSSYQSCIPNLYICGSSTHPGGGVSGMPGRNAAMEAISRMKQPTMFDRHKQPAQ